jgi:hypothetical protein
MLYEPADAQVATDQNLATRETARSAFRAEYAAAAAELLRKFDELVTANQLVADLYDAALRRFPAHEVHAGTLAAADVAAGLPDLDLQHHGMNNVAMLRQRFLEHAKTSDGQPLVSDAG